MSDSKTDSVSVFAVANYLLSKSYPLSLVQINKLCYIAYGYVAGYYKCKLFEEEIKAYRYGPVVTELYNKLKKKHEEEHKGKEKISDTFIVKPLSEHDDETKRISDKYRDVLDFVYARYARLDGLTLAELTHQEGTPWKKHYEPKKEDEDNIIIEHDTIESYFSKLIGA